MRAPEQVGVGSGFITIPRQLWKRPRFLPVLGPVRQWPLRIGCLWAHSQPRVRCRWAQTIHLHPEVGSGGTRPATGVQLSPGECDTVARQPGSCPHRRGGGWAGASAGATRLGPETRVGRRWGNREAGWVPAGLSSSVPTSAPGQSRRWAQGASGDSVDSSPHTHPRHRVGCLSCGFLLGIQAHMLPVFFTYTHIHHNAHIHPESGCQCFISMGHKEVEKTLLQTILTAACGRGASPDLGSRPGPDAHRPRIQAGPLSSLTPPTKRGKYPPPQPQFLESEKWTHTSTSAISKQLSPGQTYDIKTVNVRSQP